MSLTWVKDKLALGLSKLSRIFQDKKLFHYRHQNLMKWKVSLYIAGRVFDEFVIARNYNDARLTALARNPTARVIAVNAVFN